LDSSPWPSLLALVVLLALSAFFSGSEMAFSSLNQIRIKAMEQDGNKKAKTVLSIIEKFEKTLSTLLIGNNVVNTAAASITTVLVTQLFGVKGVAIGTAAITVALLIFGEILPKSYAKQNAEKFALGVSGPMLLLTKLLTPVVWPFQKLQQITRRDEDGEEDAPTMTEEELKYMIEAIEEEGVLEEQESELVQSALDFDEITAQEILTPRVDVEALDITEEKEEILKKVTELHYSRLPVYEGTVDNIRGVVRSRDILEAALKGDGRIDLPTLMTPCMYIHKTMKISQLLRMFQKNKAHLAVVADDYGGTLGIVTMEDVLEQLVGEIWDETDEVEDAVTRLNSSTVEVAGDENIYDFFEEIDCDTRNFESEFNTVAGWATEQLERIPEEGDSFVWQNLKVTVTEMDETRILRLRVEKLEAQQEDQD